MPEPDLQKRAMDALADDSVPPEAKQRIMQMLGQLRKQELAGGDEQPQQQPEGQPRQPQGSGGEAPQPSRPQQSVQMEPQTVTPQQQPEPGVNVQMEPQNVVPQQPPNVLGQAISQMPQDGATGLAIKSMMQGFFPQEQSEALTENLSPEEVEQRIAIRRKEEAQLGIDPEATPNSASHRVALYAPPVAEARASDGQEHPVWVHQEPTVEEYAATLRSMAEWEPTGKESAEELERREKLKRKAEAHLVTLERDGEEDEAYQAFQDGVWAKVAQEAKRVGQKAIRGAFVPEGAEGGEEVAARRMVKSPAGSVLYSALDSFSFGQAMPFLAWYNSDMEESPLGKKLSELGLYGGELEEYQKLRDSSTAGSILGSAMGLFAPGGAGRVYGKIGQRAARGAAKAERGAAGRLGGVAAAGGGVDAAAGFARTLAEQLVSGSPVDLGEAAETAAVEGAMAAGGDAMLGGFGELGSRVASRYRSGNPDLKAVEQALEGPIRGIGRPGARGPGDTGERMLSSDLSEENIVGKAMREGGSAEGTRTPTEFASEYAARRVKPTLEKKTSEALQTLEMNASQYFSTPEAQRELPVKNTFSAVKDLVQKTVGSSDRVRRSAGKAMAEISNFRAYSDRAAAEANSEGGLVLKIGDDLIEEMGWNAPVGRAVQRLRRLGDSGIGEDTWITIKPRSMDAQAHHAALQDVDAQISYGARSEDAGPGVKRLADGLRADRANWGPGYNSMMEKEHELLTKLEGTGRVLGMNFREMAGESVPQALRGSVHDMPLATLGKHLANVYQPGKGADTELFTHLLGNPKLTKLLKGIRAVSALERMRSGTAVSGRISTGSSGSFHPIVNFGNLDKIIYGRGRALERAYINGNMPKAARVLLQPEARDFIQNTSARTMEGLMKALEDKEIKDVSAND